MKDTNRNILSDITVHMKYARYMPELNRRETWEELVTRNMEMHIKNYPQLKSDILNAYTYVFDKKVLPSMRSLQFAGKPIQVSPNRLYNCSYLPVDDIEAFNEIMFLLLSGCGVGYSVQQHHIKDLPVITKPYMKPLVLKKKWEIDLKGLKDKTKKELEKLGRKVGVELDRRLTKDKLIKKIKKHIK